MRGLALLLALVALFLLPAVADAKVRTGPGGTAFYKPPAHLSGKHGGLIWVHKQTGSGALKPAAYNDLVLYRSTGEDGKTSAVSGAGAVPRRKPPNGGQPNLPLAHGTTDIAE